MAETTDICSKEGEIKMRYGITKFFKRGVSIGVFPTYVCNLDCVYCANKYGRKGNKFDSGQITPEDWYRLISHFPVKIRELYITGGEPFLYPYIQDLILILLPLGIHITLNTNLLIKIPLDKVKSDRFRIEATLHDHRNKARSKIFWENYDYYKQWVRVDVDIFSEKRIRRNPLTGISYKLLMDPKNPTCLDMKRFKFTPDGRLWTSDREVGDTYTIPGGREVE